MTALKTINYRGGIARFRVPHCWVEEYEPAGGGTFYEDGSDTGTLRINVMDFEKAAEARSSAETARDILIGLGGSGQVEQLSAGVAVERSRRTAVESDKELLIYTWQVGVQVSPAHFRLVMFTYTILAEQEHKPPVRQEMQLLDKSIAEGEYPPVRGKAGDYVHE